MTPTIAAVSLTVLLVPCIYAAWSDLAFMRLPNKLVLAVVALFLLVMPWFLPLSEVGWRFAVAFGTLAIGFFLSLTNGFGAGDAKFGAAIMLFVHPALDHVSFFLQILAMTALAGVLTHRIIRRVPVARRAGENWQSWSEEGNFPFGLSLATAILFYQVLMLVLL